MVADEPLLRNRRSELGSRSERRLECRREGAPGPRSRRLVGAGLLLGLTLLTSCALIKLPFQILGSLVSQVVRHAPKLAALVLQEPETDTPSWRHWLEEQGIPYSEPGAEWEKSDEGVLALSRPGDLSLPGSRFRPSSGHSGTKPAPRPRAAADLLEALSARPEGIGESRFVFLRPSVEGELALLGGRPGTRTFLIEIRVEVGEDAARTRRRLLRELRAQGAEVWDWTSGAPGPDSRGRRSLSRSGRAASFVQSDEQLSAP